MGNADFLKEKKYQDALFEDDEEEEYQTKAPDLDEIKSNHNQDTFADERSES